MPSERYQTRLPSDHAERVEQFVDERDISKAEAVRRLILAGLDAAEAEAEEADEEEPADADKAKMIADGGDVIRHLDRQERNQRWRSISILAGTLYLLLYLEGFRGPASIVMGILVVVAISIATYGAADTAAALGGDLDE